MLGTAVGFDSFARIDVPKQVRKRSQYVVLISLLAVASALWWGQDQVAAIFASNSNGGDTGRPGDKNALRVVVAAVGTAENDVNIEAVGNGRARRSVILVPEAMGEIVEFNVRSGDRVKQGDIIFRLDRKDAELAVNHAETTVTEAQRLFERSEKLRKTQVNSQANVDDAKSVFERAAVELSQAQEDLRKRTLVAPFDGIVGIPKVEVGDRVTTTTEIITLDDRSELYIEFDIPELYLSRVSVDDLISARTPSLEDRLFEGKIDQIDTRVDSTSRSVVARAVLPNDDDVLRPGMSFSVEVALPGDAYPLVPELALQWSKGASHVWRVDEGVVAQIPVRIVKRLNSFILVEGDIVEGDLVVVEGVQRLSAGKSVTFTQPDRPDVPLTN